MPVVGHVGCADAPRVLSFVKFLAVCDVDTITLQLVAPQPGGAGSVSAVASSAA